MRSFEMEPSVAKRIYLAYKEQSDLVEKISDDSGFFNSIVFSFTAGIGTIGLFSGDPDFNLNSTIVLDIESVKVGRYGYAQYILFNIRGELPSIIVFVINPSPVDFLEECSASLCFTVTDASDGALRSQSLTGGDLQ